MADLNEILVVTAFAAGSAMLYVANIRVRLAHEFQGELLSMADRMWKDATEANRTEDATFIRLYNQLIELTALVPCIAIGIVKPQADVTISKEQRDELSRFLERNQWVLPYMFQSFLMLKRLEFHGNPLNWTSILSSCKANLLMFLIRILNTKQMKVIEPPRKVADQVEDFVSLDLDGSDGNFAPA